jgi:two-component system, chemotaxis family, chemotaxis protein CheY
MKVEVERETRSIDPGRQRTPSGPPKRALLVDDEPAMRGLVQEVLESAEMEVVAVSLSSEAESRFQEEKFDVILIGLCGAAGEGNELVRKIRKSGFNRMTPIIVISSDQSPGALSRGFEAGASFFVYKPIDKAHLMKLVRVTQGTIEHERRRFRRVPAQVKVLLKSDKVEVEGETIDMSLNGALVAAPRIIPVGSMVEVSLYLLASSPPVVGLGTIARVLNGNQMGILLDRFPATASGRLQDFLLPKIAD